jgi:hypothetical protein
MTIATLPPSGHISVIRATLDRERMMRNRVLRGDSRTRGVKEIDQALESLKALERVFRTESNAAP